MAAITVEVVYALPDRQTMLSVELEEGATVRDALARSGILDAHPDLDLERCGLSVWGRSTEGDQALRDRDRVEICRPLLIDPKAARRQRAGRKPR